jgi:hypothetical protein
MNSKIQKLTKNIWQTIMYLNPLLDSDVASDAKNKKNGKTLKKGEG